MITVDTAGDAMANPACTLRKAVDSATNGVLASGCTAPGLGAGTDDQVVIPLSVGGTIQLDASNGAIAPTVNNASGGLEISGPGAYALEVKGTATSRVFYVQGADHDFTLTDLAISNGHADDSSVGGAAGGGIYTADPAKVVLDGVHMHDNFATSSSTGATGTITAGAYGGAAYVKGTIEATASTFSNNTASATATGGTHELAYARGGAIWGGTAANAETKITRSTLNGNHAISNATGADPDGSATGGAVNQEASSGKVTLLRSTVSGNEAKVEGAGGAAAGGINASGTGPSNITSSTIAGNMLVGFPAGGANLYVKNTNYLNTLVALPIGDDNCASYAGSFTSFGYNLESGGSGNTCNFVGLNDQTNVPNAGLGALGNYGGPTETIALLPGSPAIDKGKLSAAEPDQRNLAAPFDFAGIPAASGGDNSDIGAFELQPSCPAGLAEQLPGGSCATPPGSGGGAAAAATPGATGQQAAALKKCKKKKSKKARKKCKKKAQKLPV